MAKLNRRRFSQALVMSGSASLLGRHAGAAERTEAPGQAREGSLTDVEGIKVGHFTDSRRPTGCTAMIFEEEAAVGVDYDGSAPGETQVVLLQPVSPIERVHAIFFTGGGPMGLGAVAGAVRYLEERKIGFDWGVPNVRVPIVVGAVIDDLAVGDGRIRPDAAAAYKACQAADSGPVREGNVGAGAGATVGKMLRSQGLGGMKGGLGSASLRLGEVVIGALAVVNAAGDILDWRTGKIIAGARRPDGKGFANLLETLKKDLAETKTRASLATIDPPLHSTTIAVVATNVAFNKTELTKIAMMANCGAARAISPYHTTGDGDQLFAVSTRRLKADVPLSAVGALGGEVVAEAINRAIRAANSVEGWPAYRDFTTSL
jgi:L-aminopeptidase/D-esterase-like protein